MPQLDRIVTIGPPTRATYTATVAALESANHQINDGDPVGNIDLPGEFGFSNAQGLIQWFSNAVVLERTRFAAATDALIVAPAARAGDAVIGSALPTATTLLGGELRFYVARGGSLAPGLMFSFTLDDVMVDGDVHTFGLSAYQWRYARDSFSDLTPFSDVRFTVEFDFTVKVADHWAELQYGGAYDTIVGDAQGATTQTRRYRMRYADDVTTFMQLTDGGEAWNITGIELEGRGRTMLVDVQRTITDAQRRVELME